MAEDERISLGPEEAVALWIQGREVWNAWVEKNPIADISFLNVDFNQHRNLETINIYHWPFANFNFPTGKKNFGGTTFGDGDVSFFSATFGDGDVSFYRAKFGLGAFILDAASLGVGGYDFSDATFLGRANFANLVNVKAVTLLSFRHASFEGAFTLGSKEMFSCVPDLVGTKTSHHISLAELECASNTATHKKIFKRSVDEGDAERFRRLKELAEQNRDFEKALDFRVEEMRAARWHGDYRWPTALVEGLFWLGCDYGRDLARPLLWLFVMFGLCANVYVAASISALSSTVVTKAILFSWGQMFVYIPSSSNARDEGLQILFDGHLPDWLYFITFSQSLLTLVLLFQVGLVLRNRFKL